MRGRTGRGHVARGGRGMQTAFCMPPPPLYLPHSHAALLAKGGGWAQGGTTSHVAAHPCALFTNGGGGVMPCRPVPMPCRRANKRPLFAHEQGQAKGVLGGSVLPVLCTSRGLRPKGGGRTFCTAPCVPHLCAEVGWHKPCAWRVVPAGHQRGCAQAGHVASGGGGEGVCLHPLCVCFLAKGGGHCQQVEVRGGRVGDRSFPHVSRIHGDALLFMHCFALFSFILTFVFSRKYKIDKTFKKRSLKIGAHKAGRTV
jgi:hypothetical protein